MSISTELTRLAGAKSALKTAINAKGGNIGSQTLDQYAGILSGISGGNGSLFLGKIFGFSGISDITLSGFADGSDADDPDQAMNVFNGIYCSLTGTSNGRSFRYWKQQAGEYYLAEVDSYINDEEMHCTVMAPLPGGSWLGEMYWVLTRDLSDIDIYLGRYDYVLGPIASKSRTTIPSGSTWGAGIGIPNAPQRQTVVCSPVSFVNSGTYKRAEGLSGGELAWGSTFYEHSLTAAENIQTGTVFAAADSSVTLANSQIKVLMQEV